MRVKRRLLRLAVLASIACAVAVIGAGAILCEGALRRPATRQLFTLPFRDEGPALIRTQDGVDLRGVFLVPNGQRNGCVIVLHGIGDTHIGMEEMGRMLEADGYAALLPDSRGHGWSGGGLVTYGLREAGDVHEWVDWLETHGCGTHVYGIGESLGGAVLLQSLGVEKRFRAVVAEGAYSSFPEIALERVERQSQLTPWLSRLTAKPVVFAGLAYGYAHYGLNLWSASAVESVRHATTPVLLIHGVLDHNTDIANSRRILAANRTMVRLWEVPLAGHVGAFGIARKEFEQRVITWFAR